MGIEGDEAGTAARRPPRTPRALPSGRALAGALLITLAAGSAFVAHRSANQAPSTRYLVVTETLEQGATLEARSLGTVALELPDDLAAVREDDLEEVVGRTVRNRLDELDLLRPGDLYERHRFTAPESVEVVVELPTSRALGGSLRPGDLVDVFATEPGATGTAVIARGVLVVDAAGSDADAIGARGTVRVRLSMPGTDAATTLVDASVRAELTLALPAPSRREAGT